MENKKYSITSSEKFDDLLMSDYKDYKRILLFAGIFGGLSLATFGFTLSDILRLNIPITTTSTVGKLTYLFCASSLIGTGFSAVIGAEEYKDYNNFLKMHKSDIKEIKNKKRKLAK